MVDSCPADLAEGCSGSGGLQGAGERTRRGDSAGEHLAAVSIVTGVVRQAIGVLCYVCGGLAISCWLGALLDSTSSLLTFNDGLKLGSVNLRMPAGAWQKRGDAFRSLQLPSPAHVLICCCEEDARVAARMFAGRRLRLVARQNAQTLTQVRYMSIRYMYDVPPLAQYFDTVA